MLPVYDNFEGEVQSQIKNVRLEIEKQKGTENRVVVYTACFNRYDSIDVAAINMPGVDYYYFGDNINDAPPGWRRIEVGFIYKDPRRAAKLFKILPHLFFPDYEISVWIDANRILKADILGLIYESMKDHQLAVFSHNKRNNIPEEAAECIKRGKDEKDVIETQISGYAKHEDIESWGLYAGSFIIRRHNNDALINLMNHWWREIEYNSVRDQLSLPYVIYQSGFCPYIISGDVTSNEYFETTFHKKNAVYSNKVGVKIRRLVDDQIERLVKLRKLFSSFMNMS